MVAVSYIVFALAKIGLEVENLWEEDLNGWNCVHCATSGNGRVKVAMLWSGNSLSPLVAIGCRCGMKM